jgi:hypothetical protein
MNLEIFPNPASDELNVNLSDSYIGKTVLTFFNIHGQVVRETRLDKMQEEQTFRINIRNLPPGNYSLLVKSGDHAYANNLIIQR